MATYLYTLEGYAANGTATTAHRYSLETGIWTTVAAPPAPGPANGVSSLNIRQEGCYDGSYWYVTLMDGKLYRYDPAANSWSSALASGAVFIGTSPVSGQNWYMASDGRFVYHWSVSGFRRYDPAGDSLTLLQDLSQGTFGPNGVLEYDGNDKLYAVRGDNGVHVDTYTISTAAWTARADSPAANQPYFWAYLQGRFWRIQLQDGFNGATSAASYDPSGNAWTTKSSTRTDGSHGPASAYGELDDATLRIWDAGSGGTTRDYNVLADSWVTGPAIAWSTNQGANFAVARQFNASYTWYLSDGTTVAGPSINLGAITPGDTLNYQLKLKTTVARSAGVTLTVPQLPTTDAAQPVTISADGVTYGTLFVTGSLTAGQLLSIWVKVTPTFNQTLGLKKTFNLRVTAN